jgi:hypothetical protein
LIDFEAIENALFALVKASSGFADANVIFDSQNGVSPAPTPYATIRLGDLPSIGVDGHRWDYDVARAAGAEIVRTSTGMRDFTVTFQFFSPMSDSDPTGRLARSKASKLQDDLALPSFRGPLNDAGLGVLNVGTARSLPKLNNTDFESRTLLEVRFVLSAGARDATGFISHVNVTPTINEEELSIITIPKTDGDAWASSYNLEFVRQPIGGSDLIRGGNAFSVSENNSLNVDVWLPGNSVGTHNAQVEVSAPGGGIFQALFPPGGGDLTHGGFTRSPDAWRFLLAGSIIESSGIYGEWSAALFVDSVLVVTRPFTLTP